MRDVLDLIFCFNLQGQLDSMASRGPHYGMQHRMQGPVVSYGLHFETTWLKIFNPR